MLAIYHVFGSDDFFLETNDQRKATLAARREANKTGKPASLIMHFGGRMRITHYYPEKEAAV